MRVEVLRATVGPGGKTVASRFTSLEKPLMAAIETVEVPVFPVSIVRLDGIISMTKSGFKCVNEVKMKSPTAEFDREPLVPTVVTL